MSKWYGKLIMNQKNLMYQCELAPPSQPTLLFNMDAQSICSHLIFRFTTNLEHGIYR